jgi:hypothetical protein
MTYAQILAILHSTNETPEGKAILVLQLVSGATTAHANDLFNAVAAFNHITLQNIASAMQADAANMLAAAKAAATAPAAPSLG